MSNGGLSSNLLLETLLLKKLRKLNFKVKLNLFQLVKIRYRSQSVQHIGSNSSLQVQSTTTPILPLHTHTKKRFYQHLNKAHNVSFPPPFLIATPPRIFQFPVSASSHNWPDIHLIHCKKNMQTQSADKVQYLILTPPLSLLQQILSLDSLPAAHYRQQQNRQLQLWCELQFCRLKSQF